MTPAIRTVQLTKVFAPYSLNPWKRREPIRAVDDVSLGVEAGELFVLLGRNGAGKTTLVKMLCTLILPSGGEAYVGGHDVVRRGRKVRSIIGFGSSDERSFFWRLSGVQNLRFFAALHGLDRTRTARRIEELSAKLEMDGFLHRRFDRYSSGMRQRLALARSLLGSPRVLLLDEPTKSLDPTAARELKKTILELNRAEGCTVVLVTHDLAEAEELGDRCGVMDKGRLTVYRKGQVDLSTLF